MFHFVKESSLKRMGIKWDRQSAAVSAVNQRPNWLMAVTTRLELCKIRKTDNRLVYVPCKLLSSLKSYVKDNFVQISINFTFSVTI